MEVNEVHNRGKKSKFEIIVDCLKVALGDEFEVRKTSNTNSVVFRIYLKPLDYITISTDSDNNSIIVKYRKIYRYSLNENAIDLYYDILLRLQMIIHKDDIVRDNRYLGATKYSAWTSITCEGRVSQIKGFTILIRGNIIYVPRLKDSKLYRYNTDKRAFNIQTFLTKNTRSHKLSERTTNIDELDRLSYDILKDFIESILNPLSCEAK